MEAFNDIRKGQSAAEQMGARSYGAAQSLVAR